MSAETAVMTDKEVLDRFSKLLAICRELKAQGRLYSAYVYSVKDGKLHAEPIPPTEEGIDLPATVSGMLSSHQQIRSWLSKNFDLNSAEWNGSAIGRMLNHIEHELRKQTDAVQQAARQNESGTHNSLSIAVLSGAMVKLVPLLLDRAFWRQSQSKRLARLNQEAEEFFRINRNQQYLQLLGMMGEMAIALDTLIAEQGTDRAIVLLRSLVKMTDAFEDYLSQSK